MPPPSVARRGGAGGGPTTNTYSPRGFTLRDRSAASPVVVRQTSSWIFVNSRQTAMGRSGPHTDSRSSRARCSRCGDSKMTTARSVSPAMAANRSPRWRPERGTNPSKQNRSVDNPDITSAASAADGPGTVSTGIPSASAARTRRAPGSLTRGVPASVTMATEAPALARSTAPGVVAASLWRWCDTSRGPKCRHG